MIFPLPPSPSGIDPLPSPKVLYHFSFIFILNCCPFSCSAFSLALSLCVTAYIPLPFCPLPPLAGLLTLALASCLDWWRLSLYQDFPPRTYLSLGSFQGPCRMGRWLLGCSGTCWSISSLRGPCVSYPGAQ